MIEVLVSLYQVNDKDAGDAVLRVTASSGGDCILLLPDGTKLRMRGLDLDLAVLTAMTANR